MATDPMGPAQVPEPKFPSVLRDPSRVHAYQLNLNSPSGKQSIVVTASELRQLFNVLRTLDEEGAFEFKPLNRGAEEPPQ